LELMPEYELVTTPEALEELVKQLRRQRVIAIDSEADSFFHYVDKLCLLQFGYKGGIALVDPLELPAGALSLLDPVLSDPKIRKVLHAADYDLFVLQRYGGGLKLRNIFDTMISAQLLGYRAVGLAALVSEHFGVELAKDQQRTDWSRRPLRAAQLEYAAADVRYLIELSGLLEGALKEKKRIRWAQAEFAALEEKVWPEREFDEDGYMRIKGAKQLSGRGRAILKQLYLLRDKRARERDRPPFKVLGNGTLLDLAQKPPRSKRALNTRRGITDLVVRRMGSELLEAIERGTQAPEEALPDPRRSGTGRRRLDRRAEQRLEKLKNWRAKRSRELELDPGVFCPNAALEEIAWAHPKCDADLGKLSNLKSWWVEDFGEEAVALTRSVESSESGAAKGSGGRPRKAGTPKRLAGS